MNMRKICKVVLSTTLVVTMAATPVFADEISDLQNQKDQAQSEVSSLESELTTLVGNMNQLEDDLIAKGEEISQAQSDLDAAEDDEEAQRKAMSLRIKYMYEDGNASLVAAILSSDDVADALNKAEYASNISTYDRNMIQTYINTQNEIASLKSQLETEQAEMQSLQAQYEEQQTTLTNTITEKQAEVANFDSQLQEAIAAEAARKAAEEAAKQAAASQRNATVANNNTGSTSSSGSTKKNSSASYNANTGNAIVDAAYSQLGVPYVWGGTSPGSGLDCSGLTQYCYACAGISIPRTSGAQLAGGTIVSDPQPGDICWTPGHVAIYIGGGQMIEAQQTGVPVKISSVRATYYVRY